MNTLLSKNNKSNFNQLIAGRLSLVAVFKRLTANRWSLIASPAASRQRGMTLVFTVLIVSTILMIALALGIFSFGQMRMIYSAKDSAYAIFGGTSGIERALYGIRIADDCAGGNTPSYNSTLTNESSYDVTVTVGCSPSSAIISSNGKYRQTTRKIEASY